MKAMLVLFIAVVTICSCTKDNTDAVKLQIARGLATGISSGFQCKNTVAIENDISKILGVQKFEAGNPVLSTICTIAVTTVIPLALEKGIPASWECDPKTTVDAIKAKGKEFCKGL